MDNNSDDRISAVRTILAEKLGGPRFELWFATARFALADESLSIKVANQFTREFLRLNFLDPIRQAFAEACAGLTKIDIQVDSSKSADRNPSDSSSPSNGKRPNSSGDHSASNATTSNSSASSSSASSNTVANTVANKTARRRFANLDAFVTGDGNRLAATSARMIAEQPDSFSSLFVHGPSGVGKTHLLEGIWTAAKLADRQMRTVFLSAEQFTTYFVEALRGSGLPNFRRKYRGVGLLIIDDLQFFAGKRATLVELLHTIDTLLRDGKRLVFASDRSPAELKSFGPELATRLGGGMVCRIEMPDYQTRLGIVRQMAAQRRGDFPETVLTLIARRLNSSSRELSGALNRLVATSQALGQPISRSLAEAALAEMFQDSGRPVRLADVERAICDVFGLEPDSLQSAAKAKAISHPRMLAMWLARKHTPAALSEIGRFFGGRSHSTVVSAQKKVDRWVADKNAVQLSDQAWQVEEAIRRLEENLRVG